VSELQADEIHRKKEFFAELSVFSHYSEETLENMCKWFRISSFYPGQTIAQQGDDRDEIAFILTGEVSVVMDVPTLSRHHGASSRHHAPGLTRRSVLPHHM
jgi:signal-transduction protein with cAMP-binding, CBS, and nucleotidyltransferase domain